MINIHRILLVFLLTLFVLGISYEGDSKSGTLQAQPSDQTVDPSDITNPLFRIKVDGQFGYINIKGEIVIKPQYYQSNEFSEGLALVFIGSREKHESAYIDKAGNFAIKPPSPGGGDFKNGLARAYVLKDDVIDKCGFIDKTGKWAIEPLFDDVRDFSEGLAAFRNGKTYAKSWGFINAEGKVAIHQQFDHVGDFSDGMAQIQENTQFDFDYGYINKKGEVVIKPQYISATDFSEGYAAVEYYEPVPGIERWMYIDKTGKKAFDRVFSGAWAFEDGFASAWSDSFFNTEYGFIDHEGNFHTDDKDRLVGKYSENLAFTHKNGKSAYIDKTGKIVFTIPREDFMMPFKNGLASSGVILKGETKMKRAYYDKTGKVVFIGEI